MQNTVHLLRTRRFLPIFATQFLGAFNDNLFRTSMVMLVIYGIYRDATQEAAFSAIAGGLFILPFFLLSALAGQLADAGDKAFIIRIVKTAEIIIMLVGAAGLLLHNVPLLLLALCAMGVHSTFFGPIKYAILPQHLHKDEVLGGTGLVEAGTYIAILGGTLLGGVLVVQRADGSFHAEYAALAVLGVAVVGRIVGGMVPPAPPAPDAPPLKMDWHIVRASISLVNATLHIPRLFLAILAISFFWAMGAVLAAQFPPLVKNALGADQQVATLFLAIFSIGVAIGSVAVNRLLKGHVSARYSPASALGMGLFVLDLYRRVKGWPGPEAELRDLSAFLAHSGRLSHHARPARRGDLRRHVRGAALRLPHHHRAQVRNRANDRRQQHRQFGPDGGGDLDPDGRGAVGGDRRRQPADRRHRQRHGGVARLEAPPRLRLAAAAAMPGAWLTGCCSAQKDGHEQETRRERHREQANVFTDRAGFGLNRH